MENDSDKSAQISPHHSGLSAIWLIPLIALVFAIWLTVKAISDRGVFINIEFDNANGIVAGKTEVRYKGLTVGLVKQVEVSKDFQRVIVDVEMLPSSDPLLTDKTQFWYVTADISLEGVSALDTLLSGGYISILPDLEQEGKPQHYFVALKSRPTPKSSEPGLHIKLLTSELGSLGSNSTVTFKQMPVGRVTDYRYQAESQLIEVDVLIEPEHAELVRENSRFWISSGINVTASLSGGIKLRTESIASLITGGIAFDNVDYEVLQPQVDNNHKFTLYRDYQHASMGHEVELILPWDSGLDRSAAIIYQGINIGQLEKFKAIEQEERKIVAVAKVDPRVKPYLTDQTQFFVVSPEIDVSGLNNLNALLLGSYIGIRPSNQGNSNNTFTVLTEEPPLDMSAPGLHLVLNADKIGSLSRGAGVFNNHKQVGTIQDIHYLPQQKYRVLVHIEPEYQHFIRTNTKFWNASGLRIAGGIQNFDIQAQSLKTILAGGIGFTTEESSATTQPATNAMQFALFDNEDQAKFQELITLNAQHGSQILPGITKVRYQGKRVGLVHGIQQHSNGLEITVGVNSELGWIKDQASEFWLVKPEISLSGLTDTDALFGGAYISFNPGSSGQTKDTFILHDSPLPKLKSAPGLQLVLNSLDITGMKVGSQIMFKSIGVGQVDAINLSEDGKSIDYAITINDKYRQLIQPNTRFYKSSGMSVDAALSGIKFKTDSVDAWLLGAISFYTPNLGDKGNAAVKENARFPFYSSQEKAERAGDKLYVDFPVVDGLREGMAVKHKSTIIGQLSTFSFDQNKQKFAGEIVLYQSGSNFIRHGSQFWIEKPEINFANMEGIVDAVAGAHIQARPGQGEPSNNFDALPYPPVVNSLPTGLNVTLTTDRLGSIKIGNPVLFRQFPVGRVIGNTLAGTADKVLVFINIEARYQHLVSPESRFWHASGIEVDAGLLSGVNVRTESMETLISGGISFATPRFVADSTNLPHFPIAKSAKKEWLNWKATFKK